MGFSSFITTPYSKSSGGGLEGSRNAFLPPTSTDGFKLLPEQRSVPALGIRGASQSSGKAVTRASRALNILIVTVSQNSG